MPSLNARAYIAQAVHSVFAQGVDALELVVADGASSDGTVRELVALAARWPGKLRWRSLPDAGPAAAVNDAVARARGDILGWLNADDVYAEGAVARALAHFERQPDHVMVYGEGDHIDAAGARLGRYPTRPPGLPLAAWADGCPVCQPTVFLRRDTFLALGGLDTALRTAFDFDLWLRLCDAAPGRIGFIPALQAGSRLHPGAITMRLREQVALEGMAVVHRHLGVAPPHWVLTHVDEVLRSAPFAAPRPGDAGSAESPAERLQRVVRAAERWLTPADLDMLRQRIATHRALQLATPHLFANVHADGWAPPRLSLRGVQPERPFRRVHLRGRHAAPHGGPLQLRFDGAGGRQQALEVPGNGAFGLTLELGAVQPGERWQAEVRCLNPFVPSQVDPSSTDTRELAFLLEELEGQ